MHKFVYLKLPHRRLYLRSVVLKKTGRNFYVRGG